MDLDSRNDPPYARERNPQKWDWVTQVKIPDFETVDNSHKRLRDDILGLRSFLNDNMSFALQNSENKTVMWCSFMNGCLRLCLQRDGPREVGQGDENGDSALPDWIKTTQAVSAGLFKPYDSDNGGRVYRAKLGTRDAELSENEMEALLTFSAGVSDLPSVRETQLELQSRKVMSKSVERLALQLSGKQLQLFYISAEKYIYLYLYYNRYPYGTPFSPHGSTRNLLGPRA